MTNIVLGMGGTGAKTLEPFIYLCASGLINEETTVCLIDQDEGNGNASDVKAVFDAYLKIAAAARPSDGKKRQKPVLFATRLKELSVDERPLTFPWQPETEDKPKLRELFARDPGFGTDSSSDSGLMDCLFAAEEQQLELHEGFRARPAIGALVFARQEAETEQLPDRQSLHQIIDAIVAEVQGGATHRVFVAGSIYGGTGASALPTIARMIAKRGANAHGKLMSGGALLLPYYKFPQQPDEDKKDGKIAADSTRFIEQSVKTIPYYERLMDEVWGPEKQRTLSQLYLIGFNPLFSLDKFDDGGKSQKNRPLIPELYAALFGAHFLRVVDIDAAPAVWRIASSGSTAQPTVGWRDLPAIGENNVRDSLGSLMRFCCAYHFGFHAPLTDENGWPRGPATKEPWYKNLLGHGFEQLRKDQKKPEIFADIDNFCVHVLQYFGALSFSTQNHPFKGPDFFAPTTFVEECPPNAPGAYHGLRVKSDFDANNYAEIVIGDDKKRALSLGKIVNELNHSRAGATAPWPWAFLDELYAVCSAG